MGLDPVVNFGEGDLLTGIDSSALTMTFVSGEGAFFPAIGSSNVTIYNSTDYVNVSDAFRAGQAEIVTMTNSASDTKTIARAQEGTTAVDLNTSSKTYRVLHSETKKKHDAIDTALTTSAGLLAMMTDETGIGALVFNDTPTILTPTIASFANAAHDHLNAAGGGTITEASVSDLGTLVAMVADNLSVFAATTSLQFLGLISDETGTGLVVFNDTPTLLTPTIGDFTNATHSHLNNAGGGTITEAAISDLQAYILDISGSPLSELSDVTITTIASGEILKWSGSAWINNTLAEAGISAPGHTHTESEISDLGTTIALVADNLSVFASTTSLQLLGVISDGIGTGSLTFATAPTFTTSITVTGGGVIDAGGIDLDTGNAYEINNADVLNATTLGGAVVSSSLTSLGTLTTLTIDDITINGNAISSGGASALTIDAFGGQAVTVESVSFDGGVVTNASSITSTSFIGALTGQADTVGTITGLAPDTATTQATQPNITSLGTLTTLTIDDITINGNTISSDGASSLAITPTTGQAILLDGAISIDAGVVTGATSITSTSFVGALTGNADTVTTNANLTGPITSVGNATSIAAQTGTGTTFVMNTSPTLVTPEIGVATGTSIDIGGTTLLASRSLTVDTGGIFDVVLGGASGDDFKINGANNGFVYESDTGNVGIGTTDPAQKLDVKEDSATTDAPVVVTRRTVTSSGTPAAGLAVAHEDVVETVTGNKIGVVTKTVATDVDAGTETFRYDIDVMTGGAPASTVASFLGNGKVGIGTTEPGEKVHTFSATGNLYYKIEAGGSGISGIKFKNNSGEKAIYQTNDSLRFVDTTDGRIEMVLDGNGNVGIGTPSPGTLLALGLAGTTSGVISFAGSTSGIVTIQPAAVAGTYTLTLPPDDGNAGEFLQTNGSGVTSWHPGTSDAFSSMWYHGAEVTTSIGAVNTLVKIATFENVGIQDPDGHVVGDATTGNDFTIGADGGGAYRFPLGISFAANSGNNKELTFVPIITLASALDITAATNATPIVITSAGHGKVNGDIIVIAGATGNTAANGDWLVSAKTVDDITLVFLDHSNSVGNGAYDASSADITKFGPGGTVVEALMGGTTIERGVGPGIISANLVATEIVELYVFNTTDNVDVDISQITFGLERGF